MSDDAPGWPEAIAGMVQDVLLVGLIGFVCFLLYRGCGLLHERDMKELEMKHATPSQSK